MFFLCRSIFLEVRNTVWCTYSDDVSITVDAMEADVRTVLWSDPHPAYAKFDTGWGKHNVSFSPDETWMAMTRGLEEGTNADMYVSQWDGVAWSEPFEFIEINSPANELGAAWGANGKCLYFVSDREGGQGGYDIWVARWTGGKWGAVTNLGAGINSPADELGPTLTRDGEWLYFSSDRPGAKEHDIFRAALIPAQPITNAPTVPPVPLFEAPERVAAACSAGNDMGPTLSGRGDFLYFASDRGGGLGGFDIYWSRVVDDRVRVPENLWTEVNSAADDRAPAVRMEGFDIVFSSNRGAEREKAYRLYSSTAREVIPRLDLSRWFQLMQLLDRVKWWLVLLVMAFFLLLYLLKHYRDLTDLRHKCIMASFILHLALLLVMAFWMISIEIRESMDPRSAEVALDVDSLAREKLALDMQDDVAEMPPADVSLPVEQAREDLPEPEFEPAKEMNAPPVVTKTTEDSLVTKVMPSKLNEEAMDAKVRQKSAEIPDLQMPEIEMPLVEVVMEEMAPAEQQKKEEPSVESVEFDVAEIQQVVAVEFEKTAKPDTQPMVKPEGMIGEMVTNLVSDVARRQDSGDTIVMASAGTETAGVATHLSGDGKVRDVLMDVQGTGRGTKVVARGKLRVPGVRSGVGQGDGKVAIDTGAMQGGVTIGFKKGGRVGTGGPGTIVEAGDLAGGVGSGSSRGAKTRDTGGTIVVASAGLEGRGMLPRLRGIGDTAKLMIKSPGRGMKLRVNAPGKLDIPKGWGKGISPHILKYPGKLSTDVVESLGGSAATQGSIGRALDWFTKNQEPDGRWDIKKHGGDAGHDVAATSLALLCYYGWGAKHTEDGPHRDTVTKALKWLVGRMKGAGDFCSGRGGNVGMYDQGMATIALCEAYGLTKDEALRGPAEKALGFILGAQDGKTGGWRYQPRMGSDTSVFGWQYMALHSAKIAGLNVPDSAFAKARKWLDAVGGGKRGGIYGYQKPESKRPAMIARPHAKRVRRNVRQINVC